MSLIRLSKKGWDKLNELNFTPREYEVVSAFLNSKCQHETGKKLFINHKTIKHHMGHIYLKLGFRGVTQLWQFFIKERMVELVLTSDELPPIILPVSAINESL